MFHHAVDPTKLLASFPVARTTSREAFETAVRGPYNVSHFDFPERTTSFEATNSRVCLHGLTLHHAHYKAPVRMKFPGRPGIRQPIVLSGHSIVKSNHKRYDNTISSSLILCPDDEFVVECWRDYHHILLDFNEDELIRHSFNLSGYAPTARCRLRPLVADNASKLARLGSIATVLAFNLTSSEALGSPILIELEQALLSAFLIENGLVTRVDVTLPATADAIRALRDYIHANWKHPLTIEDIARECNVSARSVFLQFNKTLGVSPMTYLRNVRLDESRARLQDKNEEHSVIRIALECGFSSLGHFARRYRERFGELPSDTVRKAGHVRPLGRRP